MEGSFPKISSNWLFGGLTAPYYPLRSSPVRYFKRSHIWTEKTSPGQITLDQQVQICTLFSQITILFSKIRQVTKKYPTECDFLSQISEDFGDFLKKLRNVTYLVRKPSYAAFWRLDQMGRGWQRKAVTPL